MFATSYPQEWLMAPTQGQFERVPVVPLAVSVDEAAIVLGVSSDLVYEMVHRGQLPCLRIGRRRVIPRRALEQVVEEALAGFDPRPIAEALRVAVTRGA
jgi:excisionase family DNA binding protein